MARPVRVVAADERKTRLKTLSEAISGGNYLEILLAQRREIVDALPNVAGPATAALHRQLRDISKEIETLKLAATSGDGSVVADTADDAWDASAI